LLKSGFRLPPAIVALFLQLFAFACALLITHVAGIRLPLMAFALICGLFAAVLGYVAKLDRWWLLILCVFAPALAMAFVADIRPGYFLAAFLIMLLVYWNTFRTQVPLYLSSEKVWQALERFLPPPKPEGFTFVDIGSGLGGVLSHLAKVRPDGDYCGIESAPLPFLWSSLRLSAYKQCRVRWGNLWDCNLSRYDVVFAYLSPAPMERLWHKAKAEMRPGTVFISSTFAVPGQTPVEVVETDDLHKSTLLVWRM
jgi:hypothetical protein